MAEAITNTSPLVYLHRIQALDWLPRLFQEVWTPPAVLTELNEGLRRGYDVPRRDNLPWIQIKSPTSRVSEWLNADFGAGELEAMTLALENPTKILILDDGLARRAAQAAGFTVWGTLRVLLEAKTQGLTDQIGPQLDQMAAAGLWFSAEVRARVLRLAGE